MAPQPPQLSEGIPQQKAGTDQGTFPPDPSDATPGVTPAPPPLSLLAPGPFTGSLFDSYTPRSRCQTIFSDWLHSRLPQAEPQTPGSFISVVAQQHKSSRQGGTPAKRALGLPALAACAPIPHTPLLFLLVQWGDLFWSLLWVLQRFWVTATAHTPMAPQLQHHQSISRETPKKSFQYTPAHLEAKATQSISQLSYASGVFTALHFMAQH